MSALLRSSRIWLSFAARQSRGLAEKKPAMRFSTNSKAIRFRSLANLTSNLKNINTRIIRYASSQSNPVEVAAETNSSGTNQRAINNLLDEELMRLDLEARKTGRLYMKDVESVLRKMELSGDASVIQILLLIRCCGSLLPFESPEKRNELTKEVWKTLKNLKLKLDASHYNALLKVHLENQNDFLPTDFLAEMEKDGIEPNRVTYQRLISRYCHLGDIEGASKILEFMKSKDLPVNELVFNELIFGHAKANDMSGAKEMLEVMQNAKLEPSSQTYKALAKGHALHGNLNEIKSVFEQAKNQEVPLQDKDILNVILTLANSEHSQVAEKLFDELQKNPGYNQECINVILELITSGQDSLAYKLFETMPRAIRPDGTLLPSGQFFVKQLIINETPVERILDYLNRLKETKVNENALSQAAQVALFNGKNKQAIAFIKEMAKQGLPIRNHYFWPILRSVKTEEEAYSILELMTSLGCPPNFETVEIYALPHLNTSDPETVIHKFKNLTLPAISIVNPLMYYFLDQGKSEEAAKLLDSFPIRLNSKLALKTLSNSFGLTGDIPSVIKILKHVRDNPEMGADQVLRNDICGQFILDCIPLCSNAPDKLKELLNEMLKAELYISCNAVDMIRLKAINASELDKILESLSSLDLQAPLLDNENISHPREMNIEELENHLLELREKNMNVRGVLRKLLMLHCRDKNLERVEEIKAELDLDNMIYSGAMYSQLLFVYTVHGKTEKAVEIHKQIKQLEPDFVIDTFKIINLATLLVKDKKSQDALELLDSYIGKKRIGSQNTSEVLERNVYRLLSSSAEQGDVKLTRKLYELSVVRAEFAKPTSNVLGQVIRAHLMDNDFEGALKEFENCVINHQLTPLKNELLRKLIVNEDLENIQKVLELGNKIHGETNILYDLGMAFIETDRFKQAKKVFETPGLRANMARFERICDNYINIMKIDYLEQFVELTKNIFNIDKERMYYHLVRGFAATHQIDKALNVWVTLQEEDIQPRPETLLFLGQFLKKNDRPVPFTIPKIEEGSSYRLMPEKRQTERKQTERIENSQPRQEYLTDPIHIQSRIIDEHLKENNHAEASKEVLSMLKEKKYPRHQTMNQYLRDISKIGDIETFASLKPYFSNDLQRKYKYSNYYSRALLETGQGEKLFNQFEDEYFTNQSNFPSGGFLALLNKCPELEEKICSLIERYQRELNFLLPKNMFWIHLMASERYQEADQILKDCPEMVNSKKFIFNKLFEDATRKENLDLANKLISIVEEYNCGPIQKGLAYSALINMHLYQGDTDQALSVLQSACEKIEMEYFKRSVLIQLQKKLRRESKKVPFFIPQIKKEDSSSSSDES